jgi:hypothetical protein
MEMMWIVEQRDPAGEWSIIRATVFGEDDAEDRARLYKAHNPRLRFRYRPTDEDGEPPDDDSEAIEV